MTDSNRCRVSEDEIANDQAQCLDESEGLNDTPSQAISDRVDELMDADSADSDSITVLMESERFNKALSGIWSVELSDDQISDLMTSPYFVHHLRSAFGVRYQDKKYEGELLSICLDLNAWARNITGLDLNSKLYPENYELLKNLISVAEEVLTEYAELQL